MTTTSTHTSTHTRTRTTHRHALGYHVGGNRPTAETCHLSELAHINVPCIATTCRGRDGEWFTRHIFPGSIVWNDDNALREMGFEQFHNGPGREFGRAPQVRHIGAFVVITQTGGLDI